MNWPIPAVLCVALGVSAAAWGQPTPGFADAEFSKRYAPAWPQGLTTKLNREACKPGENYSIARATYRCAGTRIEMGPAPDSTRRDVPLLVGFKQGVLRANLGRLKTFQSDGVPFLDSVHQLDLNADGEPDWLMEFSYHGNGLAAVRRTLVFVLSGAKGYRLVAIDNLLAPGDVQLVKDKTSGAARLMLGRMSSDVSDKDLSPSDKKAHTFFVFDVIGFGVQPEAPLMDDREFAPVYVQYTYSGKANPAQRATGLLSQAQIRRHWASPLQGMQVLPMAGAKE